jgi:hypothetical protein
MGLLYNAGKVDPAEISDDWLKAWSAVATVVLILVPFAGIAFLWFTGVMRDLVGDLEDQFFATVFLGSGLILVAMLFTWGAAFGALFGTYAAVPGKSGGSDVFVYGSVFMNQIIGNYFLRMAAVYMMSIASLWTRTDVVSRWLIIVTYVVGLGFLLFASALRPARFIFPLWVLLVSIYILVVNYRRTQLQVVEGRQPSSPENG